MGTEKDLSIILLSQLKGEPGRRVKVAGGTPNHKILGMVVVLAWALRAGTAEDVEAATAALLAFLAEQRRHHMMIGGANEFETSSHFAWWQNAMASLWFFAFLFARKAKTQRELDALSEILVETRSWWVRQVSLENLCKTPMGKIVLPGARCHVPKGMADQRKQREQGNALIMSTVQARNGRNQELRDLVARVRLPEAVRSGEPSLDRIGLYALTLLPVEELALVAARAERKAELPVPRNTLRIERSSTELLATFDRCEGLAPAYWAYAEFLGGGDMYGARESWPKNYPGGERPADLLVSPRLSPPGRVVLLRGEVA